ncbi:hypothetical protein CAMRE0001_2574 [Campylobacter rectus RM3267]|uniref:Uncharacterized protein n=1 Tax=Campylobacter rectus RM3267 TaxID=553218 RepID=B9D3V6_CAMRE|nr:hypothetical protein CAMRE0001_2574 [Campylobacter rectus RM3267]
MIYLIKQFRRLVFFLYTSLEISPKLGYVFRIRALARLISASSKEKILRLDFLYSNLKLKFTNLTVNLEVKQ